MGITKISQKFITQVTPERMFKALILDAHNICPKLMFSSIKSIEFLEGEGEVGTIKQINFTEGIDHQVNYSIFPFMFYILKKLASDLTYGTYIIIIPTL